MFPYVFMLLGRFFFYFKEVTIFLNLFSSTFLKVAQLFFFLRVFFLRKRRGFSSHVLQSVCLFLHKKKSLQRNIIDFHHFISIFFHHHHGFNVNSNFTSQFRIKNKKHHHHHFRFLSDTFKVHVFNIFFFFVLFEEELFFTFLRERER